MSVGTNEKVLLLWCRVTSSPFTVLSSNITREICHYFGAWQKLVSVSSDSVSLFDLDTCQWRPLWTLRQSMEVSVCSACTWVTNSMLFVCGGGVGACSLHTVNKAYCLKDGEIVVESTMSTGRNFPGVCYSPTLASVFIFGGAVMCTH